MQGRSPSSETGTACWPSRGVSTVFLGLPDLAGPEDVAALAALTS